MLGPAGEATVVNPRVGLFLLYGDRPDECLPHGDVTAVTHSCDTVKHKLISELEQQFEEWLYNCARTVFRPRLKIEFRSVQKDQLRTAVASYQDEL